MQQIKAGRKIRVFLLFSGFRLIASIASEIKVNLAVPEYSKKSPNLLRLKLPRSRQFPH
jgi:hypothetical protein